MIEVRKENEMVFKMLGEYKEQKELIFFSFMFV